MKTSPLQSKFPGARVFNFLSLLMLLFVALSPPAAPAQTEVPPANQWWPKEVEDALSRAGTNRAELTTALRDIPVAQREGLQFLLENMPRRDLQSLSASFLLENLALAYESREQSPWGKQIPDEIFLNDVLPFSNINEKREDWRKRLYEICAPIVKNCRTPGEAAQQLNKKLFGIVKVKYSTQRQKADQSPSESMASGLASCTGLSILLVDACRSVGVPARMAGVPNWSDNRGNHTWVEVWDQRWHFTGAAEPDSHGLDHAWFQPDAAKADKNSREHAIYAVSFKKTPLSFPMVWARDLDYISAVNVTDAYTQKADTDSSGKTRLLVKVLDHPGGRRVIAKVRVFDPGDAATKFEGSTKDESVDSNDMLAFAVPQGRTYTIEAELNGQKVSQQFNYPAKDQQVVVLNLGNPEAKPLEPKEEAALKDALAKFFVAAPEKQGDWKFDSNLDTLLRENESAVRRAAWEAYVNAPIHDGAKKDYDAKEVKFETYLSPYTVKKVGERPPHGWALFIAMHGGGNAPKNLNDSQWAEMQRHYHDQPASGGYLYLALRAPNDTWNGFYDVYVYPLVDNLIRQFLLFGDVDPDKVFIMGYSHGGYGAFAIGPKMPDHFAAIHASAGAPTDGETTAKTLRNTIFTYMIGENDHAYGRLDRDRAFDEKVKKLRGDRTDIYPVTMEFEPGYNHPNLPDREKIKDMYPAVRNPVPRELTWEMTDKVIKNFFWLQTPDPGKKHEIDAICRDNHITVTTTTNVTAADVLLDSRLVDFSQPVIIEVNGHSSTRKLKPSLATFCQTLEEHGDPEMAFSARVNLDL